MTIEIKHRVTDAVLYTAQAATSVTQAVEQAVRATGRGAR